MCRVREMALDFMREPGIEIDTAHDLENTFFCISTLEPHLQFNLNVGFARKTFSVDDFDAEFWCARETSAELARVGLGGAKNLKSIDAEFLGDGCEKRRGVHRYVNTRVVVDKSNHSPLLPTTTTRTRLIPKILPSKTSFKGIYFSYIQTSYNDYSICWQLV